MKEEIKNLRLPLFIVFEGIDGSGKSTQAELLCDYFRLNEIPAVSFAEPSEGVWGKKIRNILEDKNMPYAEEMLRLFILDREDDVSKNILPNINNSISVILDRYYYSNAAYQGAMGLSPEKILQDNREKFPEPHRIYFIDLDPRIAIERISGRNKRGGKELFEKISFLSKVREIYMSICNDRFKIIDGSNSVDDIFHIIKQDIEHNFLQ